MPALVFGVRVAFGQVGVHSWVGVGVFVRSLQMAGTYRLVSLPIVDCVTLDC